MNYDVGWLPEATEELAELWFDREIRSSVSEAVIKIDLQLAVNPITAGESRPDNRRILFETPLAVLYETFEVERKVQVLSIWYYGRRKGS